jgi:hypothetical protein
MLVHCPEECASDIHSNCPSVSVANITDCASQSHNKCYLYVAFQHTFFIQEGSVQPFENLQIN